MQSPMKTLSGRHQTSCVASKIRMFERLHRLHEQSSQKMQRRIVASAADVGATSNSTIVHFKTHYQCAHGEQLKLVGNKRELGNWDVSSARSLDCADGDAWSGKFELDGADDAKFKLALLSQQGVVWEPVSDRVLQSTPQSKSPRLDMDLSWGSEGFRIAGDRTSCASDASQSSGNEDFNSLWDPLHSGAAYPNSVTSTRQAVERRSACGVTLEPEWGVLDLDEPQQEAAVPAASDITTPATPTTEPAAATSVLESKPVLPATPSNGGATMPESTPSGASKTVIKVVASQERGLVKKKKKNVKRKGSQPTRGSELSGSLFQNVQHVVVGGLAAAVLTAMGAHFQDVFFGSISIAAGVAALPSVLTSKRPVLDVDARASVLPVLEGIGEAVLKTAYVFNAVRQTISERFEPAPPRKVYQTDSDSDEELTEEEFEEQLAEYVAGLVEEATEFAQNFCPSQELLAAALQSADLRGEEGQVGSIAVADVRGANDLAVQTS